jgi:hypothetical protein
MFVYRQAVIENEPFKLTSILKEGPPAGADGISWHRYVITQGENTDNTITGHRQGSTRSVTLAVEEIVLHLNERRVGKFTHAFLMPPSPPRKSSSI